MPRASGGLLPPWLIIAVAAAFAAGCAHDPSRHGAGGPVGVQTAHMGRLAEPEPKDLEADGLPVQSAPFRTERPVVDDPSEPFSPNYGRVPLRPREVPEQLRGPAPEQHTSAHEPRIVASRPLSDREAQRVMMQAIAIVERGHP
ncbi:MAG: hypothetical protein ACFCUN_07950 [Hyphomicrobiaceae bacterium]